MTILQASTTRPREGGASFSLSNRVERLAWQSAWLLLARWTPPMFSPWRVWLLRRFGARIRHGGAVAANVRIWLPRHLELGVGSALAPAANIYNMAPITIGDRSVVSQGAFLCAGSHDITDEHFQLLAKPIRIGDDCWIAAEAFVAPGVTVQDGAVLAARACAFSSLKPWTVYRGNPAVEWRARRWRGEIPSSPPARQAR